MSRFGALIQLLSHGNTGSQYSILPFSNSNAQSNPASIPVTQVLAEAAEQYPQEFFDEVDQQFSQPANRLLLTQLLSNLALRETFPIRVFSNHQFMMNFLLSLFVDNSTSLFALGLSTTTVLVPNFAINSPARLKEVLPELFAILARAICWQPSDSEHEEIPDVWHKSLEVRADLRWQRLDSSSELAASNSPDASRYFTALYGVYPLSCIAFLQEPIAYLIEHGCRSPFTAGWEDILYYEDVIRRRCKNIFRTHIIHPALIRATAQQELDASNHWNTDFTNIATACSLLDVNNASHATLAELQALFDIRSEGRNLPEEDGGSVNPVVEHGRSTISLKQLMQTHLLLRSGVPVNLVDDYIETPSTPRVRTTLPVSNLATMELEPPLHEIRSLEAASLTSTQREETKDEAISVLQREVLSMMNELNFETYLRRVYLAEIWRLQRQNVRTRGSEFERQRMREKIRQDEDEIERHKLDKQKSQNEIDLYRAGGDNFSRNMHQRLHKMKEEKDEWLAEAQILRTRDVEMQDVLQAKSARLQDTKILHSKLKGEIQDNGQNIEVIKSYERKIEALRKAEQTWHEDGRRLKWQDELIEQHKAKLTAMQSIIDSESHISAHLADENKKLGQRAGQLEEELEHIRFTTSSSRHLERSQLMEEHEHALPQWMEEREKAFKERVAALEAENAKLRSTKHRLEGQLLQEQTRKEGLEARERMRMGGSNAIEAAENR